MVDALLFPGELKLGVDGPYPSYIYKTSVHVARFPATSFTVKFIVRFV